MNARESENYYGRDRGNYQRFQRTAEKTVGTDRSFDRDNCNVVIIFLSTLCVK